MQPWASCGVWVTYWGVSPALQLGGVCPGRQQSLQKLRFRFRKFLFFLDICSFLMVSCCLLWPHPALLRPLTPVSPPLLYPLLVWPVLDVWLSGLLDDVWLRACDWASPGTGKLSSRGRSVALSQPPGPSLGCELALGSGVPAGGGAHRRGGRRPLSSLPAAARPAQASLSEAGASLGTRPTSNGTSVSRRVPLAGSRPGGSTVSLATERSRPIGLHWAGSVPARNRVGWEQLWQPAGTPPGRGAAGDLCSGRSVSTPHLPNTR